MKIKNLTITSPSALDLELDIISPVCLLYGEHSELALDLIRELIGDYGAKNDPDCYDDGHFVIHSDIEIDGKNYNVCYIRNADFIGDNRIAANFIPNSFDFSKDDTEEFIEKCRLLMGKQIDGVIIHGSLDSEKADEVVKLNSKHPVVMLAHPQTIQDIPSVHVDGEKINHLMVQHLMENGHRRIAVQCHGSESRRKGATDAVAGTDANLYFVPVTVRTGKDLLEWLLAHPEKPTAVSAYSDDVAFELIGAAYDRGIRIPEDLSVIGCDGDDFGAFIRPALTSVKQPDTEQGGEAVRVLLKKMENGNAESVVLQPELLNRASVADLNKKAREK